jgi:hypothetical protein
MVVSSIELPSKLTYCAVTITKSRGPGIADVRETYPLGWICSGADLQETQSNVSVILIEGIWKSSKIIFNNLESHEN